MLKGEALIFINTGDDIVGLKIKDASIEDSTRPNPYYNFVADIQGIDYKHELTVHGEAVELDKEGQDLFKIFAGKIKIDSFS